MNDLQTYEGYCCLDGCCGPGSWCCKHANPHTHEDDDDAVVPA